MNDITLTAYSQQELDERIADASTRGYEVKRQGNNFTHWDRKKFFAVMEKEKEAVK